MTDPQCGWGPCRPTLCQRFRDPKWLLFCMCIASFVQNMIISGFMNVNISSIERRYELSSAESGLIPSAYDIASSVCLLPVSYLGGMGSKPRYIGTLYFIFGVGALLFSFPHFFSGTYESGSESLFLCNSTSSYDCSNNNSVSSISNFKYFFYICMAIMGLGTSALYTLGTTYIEESVPVRWASVYLGFYYGCSVLGPAIGYLLGGSLLDIYVDVDKVDSSSITIDSTNERFVGAWWISILMCGCLAILASVPLCGFPSEFPNSAQYKKEREKEVYKGKQKESTKADGNRLKNALHRLLKTLKVLFKNPTFVCLSLASAAEGIILVGVSTFAPKFIEVQFQIPSSTAAVYVGVAGVPTAAAGTMLGGYLIKRLNLKMKGILKLNITTVAVAGIFSLSFLVSCPSSRFSGVNTGYGDVSTETKFLGSFKIDTCHSSCGCSPDEPYKPICGRDGNTYFSPCYGGCLDKVKTSDKTHYHNCSCIGTGEGTYDASADRCASDCGVLLPVFLVVLAVYIFTTFFASIPTLSATLRCVPPDDRPFAVGIDLFITKVLGYVPGPIIFGALIDMSCNLWQTSCGETGNCYFYDNKSMGNNLLAINIVSKCLTLTFCVLAFIFYKPAENEVSDTQETVFNAPEAEKNGNLSASQETGISYISK